LDKVGALAIEEEQHIIGCATQRCLDVRLLAQQRAAQAQRRQKICKMPGKARSATI
jgi:hypothetical protein